MSDALKAYNAKRAAERQARLTSLLKEIGRTGLTETSAQIKHRLGRKVSRDLSELMDQGKIARIGDRYFPISWLP